MSSGPEGAVRRNPASDLGPDTGIGYSDNPLRLPYPPQADSQPSADSSGQISVQTHGIGDRIEQPKYQVEKAKALFSKGEERKWGGERRYSQHLIVGISRRHAR